MSSQAPPLPVLQAIGKTRSRLVRRAKTLSLLSIASTSRAGLERIKPSRTAVVKQARSGAMMLRTVASESNRFCVGRQVAVALLSRQRSVPAP